MGRDWRELTWWEYQALLHQWNAAHDPESGKPDVDVARLRRLMTCH